MKQEWMNADPMQYALLKDNAKANRKNMTEAESVFWYYAKGSGLGEKCRRQYVIGQYIVDFFFRKSMLIVEIDGEYHLDEEQQQADAIRQSWLESNGYRVIRFTNEEILFNTDSTLNHIKKYLKL